MKGPGNRMPSTGESLMPYVGYGAVAAVAAALILGAVVLRRRDKDEETEEAPAHKE